MRILGIDPGGTTGIAVIDSNGIADGDLVYQAMVPAEDMPKVFRDVLLPMGIDLIALEKFTISQRTLKSSRQGDALDVIGGVKWLSALAEPPVPIVIKGPSDAKTAYTDARLKELGYTMIGKHAKDALRHALLATHRRAK